MPSSLPKYLESFRVKEEIEIEGGARLCFCSGTTSTRGHFYPEHEGSWTCHLCSNFFCKTCMFVPEIDNKKKTKIFYKYDCEKPFCIACFQCHRLGNNFHKSKNETLSEAEMTKALNANFGVQLNYKSATFSETLDIYDAYVNSPDNIHDRNMDLVKKKVLFPLFSTSILISDSSLIKDEDLP